MAAIITEKFRLHNAEQFYESLSESSADTYYIGIGKPISFTSDTSGGTDLSPPTPVDDVSSEYYLWDSMIAAKKLASSENFQNYKENFRLRRKKRSVKLPEEQDEAVNPTPKIHELSTSDAVSFKGVL